VHSFLKIILTCWLILGIIYAALRLAGLPKQAALKALRIVDIAVFTGTALLLIVVTVVFG